MTGVINFDANPSVEYIIKYKEAESINWIIAPGNPTNTSPFYIGGLELNVLYDFSIESSCGIVTFQGISNTPEMFLWIEDTFVCEQDNPFTLADTYTGFSSPQGIYWDETFQRYYVVDVDDVNGNVWWFNPNTMSGYSDANHISGVNFSAVTAHVHDPVNRKIWVAGDNTNGAHVLDIGTGIFTPISYGTNGTPGSSARAPLLLGSTNVYAFSNSPNAIYLYDRITLALNDTILKSTIPFSSTYMTQAYGVTIVGNEAWVWAGSRGNGSIAIYDSNFTTLLSTIDLPSNGAQVPGGSWTPNPSLFWQSHFYDASNNRWYVSDTGSSKIFIINTVSRNIINTIDIGNKRGKNFASASFFKSELSGEIFAAVRCSNTASDIPNTKLYKLSDSGITYMYPDESTTTLKIRVGTNESWGVNQGLVSWQGGAWNIDGQLFKYNES